MVKKSKKKHEKSKPGSKRKRSESKKYEHAVSNVLKENECDAEKKKLEIDLEVQNFTLFRAMELVVR